MTEKTYTQKELEQMSDRELDAVVAKVVYNKEPKCKLLSPLGNWYTDYSKILPHYSTDASEAVKVLEYLHETNKYLWYSHQNIFIKDNYVIKIRDRNDPALKELSCHNGESFSRTVCIAAILATQESVNDD